MPFILRGRVQAARFLCPKCRQLLKYASRQGKQHARCTTCGVNFLIGLKVLAFGPATTGRFIKPPIDTVMPATEPMQSADVLGYGDFAPADLARPGPLIERLRESMPIAATGTWNSGGDVNELVWADGEPDQHDG